MKEVRRIASITGIVALTLLAFSWAGRLRPSTTPSPAASAIVVPPVVLDRPSPQGPELVTLPAGARIAVRLVSDISTDHNATGDRFSATLDGPLTVDGKVVALENSKVTGQITNVTRAGLIRGRAAMTMVLRNLVIEKQEYRLDTRPLSQTADGTHWVLVSRGKPVKYGPESRLTFTLVAPIQVPVLGARV